MNKPRLLRILNILLVFQTLAVLLWLLTLPSYAVGTGMLGFSRSRGIVILVLGLSLIGFLAILMLLFHFKGLSERICSFIDVLLLKPGVYYAMLGLGVFGVWFGIYWGWFYLATTDNYLSVLLLRLLPLTMWVATSLFLIALFSRFMRYGLCMDAFVQERKSIFLSLIIFIFFLTLAFFIHQSRLGLTRDNQVGLGWGDPGVPILGYQVLLAYVISVFFFILFSILFTKTSVLKILATKPDTVEGMNGLGSRRKMFDVTIFLLLWVLTAWIWVSIPMKPTYFSPTPRLPNFEYYPYSDAEGYSVNAQSLWVGNGFQSIVRRPLYSFFLMVLHIVVGDDYNQLANLQSIILAVFPSLIFLLAAQFDFRWAGFFNALLVIMRERNAQLLSGIADVSHTKMLMSDMPAAVGVVGFTILVVIWFKQSLPRAYYPLMAGGWLGCLTLLRTQSLVLSLVVILMLVFSFWQRFSSIIRPLLWFVLGIVLAISPWLIRNGQLSGKLVFEESGQVSALVQRYSFTMEDLTPTLEAHSESSLSPLLWILSSPSALKNMAAFMGEHFLHNQVSAVFSLPVSFRLVDNALEIYHKYPYWQKAGEPLLKLWEQCCSIVPYVSEDVPYWSGWDGSVIVESFLPVFFNIGLISIGLSALNKKRKVVGLIPILVFLAYGLSNALIRSSGWRYILPCDWAVLFVYGVGLMQLSKWAFLTLKPDVGLQSLKEAQPIKNMYHTQENWKVWLVCGLIVLVGGSIAFSERVIPRRYTQTIKERLLESVDSRDLQELGVTRASFDSFLQQERAKVVLGKILYPKFFLKGEDEPWYGNRSGTKYRTLDQFNFFVMGTASLAAVLPYTREKAGQISLPNGAEALVLGCEREQYFEVKAILFLPTLHQVLLPSSSLLWQYDLSCDSDDKQGLFSIKQ